MSSPALSLTDVVRTFPGVVALDGVAFSVRPGEVHALVGENGAGKSTLMAVAAGALAPDSGEVRICGEVLGEASASRAQELGLAVVYQHGSTLPDLSVAENLAFAMPPGRRPDMRRLGGWARDLMRPVGGEDIDPRARVATLGVAQRQLVEIAKALALRPRVLVLDEPTEGLTTPEIERLFGLIDGLKDGGAAVVYISHRLPDVLRVADRLTVLRDGRTRGTFEVSEVSEDDVVRLIVGRELDAAFPPKAGGPGPVVLSVTGFGGGRFHDVDLEVRAGEVVGLSGVEGNGQRELLRALAGLEASHGTVRVAGREVSVRSTRHARAAGVVLVPSDRHDEGMLAPLSVRENISLLRLDDLSRAGVVSRRREDALVAAQSAALDVRASGPEAMVGSLSGGNQQKVVMARALSVAPSVLLVDEPTRGVDAGARVEIYRRLREVADAGGAVLVLSSDAVELQGLCDRALVVSRGQVVRELAGDELTEEAVTGAALRAATETVHRPQAAPRRRVPWPGGDYGPSVVLGAAVLALGVFAGMSNPAFLSPFSLTSLLFLASALVMVSIGQQLVLLTGGIDLSVGPLCGLVVVVMSFFAQDGTTPGRLALGVLAVLGVALAVGLTNGLLVRGVRIAAVLATLATFIVVQGVALLLRPTPAGPYSRDVIAVVTTTVGFVPVVFVLVVALALAAEWLLRRTRAGVQLRAVGSDETKARWLGADVTRTHVAAYVLCSLFAAGAGLLLAAQVGIGDATTGRNYTLLSITAVVLGGASILGGRGSFVGALVGALLLQQITSALSFLGLGQQWQQWLPGLLVLAAAALYSRGRGTRTAALTPGTTT